MKHSAKAEKRFDKGFNLFTFSFNAHLVHSLSVKFA